MKGTRRVLEDSGLALPASPGGGILEQCCCCGAPSVESQGTAKLSLALQLLWDVRRFDFVIARRPFQPHIGHHSLVISDWPMRAELKTLEPHKLNQGLHGDLLPMVILASMITRLGSFSATEKRRNLKRVYHSYRVIVWRVEYPNSSFK